MTDFQEFRDGFEYRGHPKFCRRDPLKYSRASSFGLAPDDVYCSTIDAPRKYDGDAFAAEHGASNRATVQNAKGGET